MDNNEKLLRMEQLLLNEAEGLLNERAMAEMGADPKDEEGCRQAAAMLLMYAFGMDPMEKEEDRAFLHGWLLPSLRMLSPTPFEENAYVRKVRFAEQEVGSIRLTKLRYAPYELFPAGDLTMDEAGRLRAPLGFFGRAFECPMLTQNGREWMALKPNEMITMERYVERARGEVLVLGLGLGYYAHQISLKKEVKKVTVVERERETMELVERWLLPQFEERGKIALVEGDAVEMMRRHGDGRKVDYVFADLWHDAGDGLPIYHELKAIEKGWAEGPEVGYWIEDTMKMYDGEN